jgi:hypothetical protein
MFSLPINIDYTNYYSNSGLSTKHWGPSGWHFLFSCIMGAYPIKITKSKEHQQIKKHFKQLFENMGYIMPCIFCRESYKSFFKELPIKPFLTGRMELMFWLYQMRDKVNKKLIKQENKCYNDEKKKLKKQYKNGLITEDEYYQKVNNFKKDMFITLQSPPFVEVLDKYESIRANCYAKAKKCTLQKKSE